MKKPEILAPGGSFNSALHAYGAGADAVYAGMSAFSARKGAVNFTLEQLRRLKSYASDQNKKIYIAINTVIKESETGSVIELLHRLSEIEIDGIILQDPGLAYILENYFPGLDRHASTQMAVHNSQGVAFLKDAGFRRIILSRELTLGEIEKIRRDHEDVELEVFVHGAMCYSFSGICLASGQLLGRSGNRGECGQICRTWFDGEEKHRFSFSANDLKGGENVLKLAEMGIDSLKIEGRLKSPEYISHTVSYYKSILSGKSRGEVKEKEALSSIAFSREQTAAFFTSKKGENMVGNSYPGHRGIPVGRVLTSGEGRFILKNSLPLADRDGLLLFVRDEARQFALKTPGKTHSYQAGKNVPVLFGEKVPKGTEVFLVSRHDMNLKENREESWKPWKTPLPLTAILNDETLAVETTFSGETFRFKENIPAESSTGGKDMKSILEDSFRKSGDSRYKASSVTFINRTGRGDREIFIPLSCLKKFRQRFYHSLEEWSSSLYSDSASQITGEIERLFKENPFSDFPEAIPDRQSMGPADSLIPFGPGHKGFFPLPPLQFSDKEFEDLRKSVRSLIDETEGSIVLGINNPGHMDLVQHFTQDERVFFFTDYCTYTANRAAVLFYRTRIDRLIYSTYWIEDRAGELSPLVKTDEGFNPHLFLSRVCYRLHNRYGTCHQCGRDHRYTLRQKDRLFTVVVRDCLTWLFQKL